MVADPSPNAQQMKPKKNQNNQNPPGPVLPTFDFTEGGVDHHTRQTNPPAPHTRPAIAHPTRVPRAQEAPLYLNSMATSSISSVAELSLFWYPS